MESGPAVDIDRKTPLGVLSLISALLSLALLVASLQPPPPTAPADLLAYASSHRTLYALFASLVLAWSVLSIPLIVTLRAMLRSRSETFTVIAQLVSAIGVLLLGFAIFTSTAALLSIVTAGNMSRPEDAAYQVAIWSNLAFYLTDPGLMTWGFGQFMFGWVAWRSGVLPNWIAVVGMIGGLAGLLTLAVYQTPVLAIVQLCCFTIWGFAAGVTLLRTRGS